MLDRTASKQALTKLFRKQQVVDLDTLCRTLATDSRMSVFRRLKAVGYLSSYTHRGAFYTRADIPQFDEFGLWFHQGAGFSRAGTLKTTLVELVDGAEAGHTHRELELLLRIPVHNTLVQLVRAHRIGRERIEKSYLYVSVEAARTATQIAARRERSITAAEQIALPEEMVIEVLLEVIRTAEQVVAPAVVAEHLRARGMPVTAAQAQRVFAVYGIEEKKTAHSP